MEQKTKSKFRCGMSVSILRCQYDKKGICTFDGDGIKCANRGKEIMNRNIGGQDE